MTRGKKSPIDRAFERVRDADPPAGAKARVLRGMHARMERERDPRRRTLMIGVPTGIALAAAAAMYLVLGPGAGTPDTEVVEVREAFLEERRLRPGDEVDTGRIRVRAGGHISIEVGEARVRVDDAAELAVREGRLILRTGAARVEGDLPVEGVRCEAHIYGESQVEVIERHLQITVFAGSVQTSEPARFCRVIDLEAPTTGRETDTATATATDTATATATDPATATDTATATATATDTATATATATDTTPATPSVLAERMAAYRSALALRNTDDPAFLVALRNLRRRYPSWELSEEVDLHEVDTLVRLDRTAEARTAAARFLARHPSSARADEMRRIAEPPQ